jgi:two-component system NtrC family sensor kinase
MPIHREDGPDPQAQLLQSAKLAALGELVAGIVHELSSPLTTILGFAELLLKKTAAEDPRRDSLEVIVGEARRARSIVHNLLDFTRQSRGERQPVDVNQLLRQTLSVIGYQMHQGKIAIEEEFSPDVGTMLLDEGQMRQVFLNLINNGLQAMPEGGTLRLRTIRTGGEAVVSISDTGVGIPLEQQERVFDPFFSTKPEGTGLGLPVSLEIVHAHGGCITVDSQPGGGSTFSVRLPAEVQGEEREQGVGAGLLCDKDDARALEHLVRMEGLADGVHQDGGEVRPEVG